MIALLALASVAAAPVPTETPSSLLMKASQPREATAMLNCLVKRDGGLTACSVQSESPAQMGVGEAALSMASQVRVDLLGPDGRSRAGAFIDVPMKIRIR
ncbi:MAG: hypothetical protein JWP92_827 [Caulobacter sp.]|nr:hypothetical protein [Caulobacter sp.]